MIVMILILLILCLIGIMVCCCAAGTMPYGRKEEDDAQMEFLRRYRKSGK